MVVISMTKRRVGVGMSIAAIASVVSRPIHAGGIDILGGGHGDEGQDEENLKKSYINLI